MKIYFADTNVFLRFLLKDNPILAKEAEAYFLRAKAGKIKIIILSEILLEMEYVLRKVYTQSRSEITKKMTALVTSAYFEVADGNLWGAVLEDYWQKSVDLVDIFLFQKAQAVGGEVLSFDRDFKKLLKK